MPSDRCLRELFAARLEMACVADYAVVMDEVDGELRTARELHRGLLSKVIAAACTRLPSLSKLGRAGQVDQLAEAGAWTDAALALIALELPGWKVRRLAYENGEWLCSLSRQPNVPIALDDTADAVHDALPLAILLAFVEARQRTSATRQFIPAIPQAGQTPGLALCCDNFT
jgi:hypothetical protein